MVRLYLASTCLMHFSNIQPTTSLSRDAKASSFNDKKLRLGTLNWSKTELNTHQDDDIGRWINGSADWYPHFLSTGEVKSSLPDECQVAVGHDVDVRFQSARFNYLFVALRTIRLAEQNVVSNGAVEQPRLLSGISDCWISAVHAGEWRSRWNRKFKSFHAQRRTKKSFISLVPLDTAGFHLRLLQQSTDNWGFSASTFANNNCQQSCCRLEWEERMEEANFNYLSWNANFRCTKTGLGVVWEWRR